MDQPRFEVLHRAFVAPSRRSILTAAGVTVIAALLDRGVPDTALAKKKKKKKRKDPPLPPEPPPGAATT